MSSARRVRVRSLNAWARRVASARVVARRSGLQNGAFRATVRQRSYRRPQHLQFSTPPHLLVDAADPSAPLSIAPAAASTRLSSQAIRSSDPETPIAVGANKQSGFDYFVPD